MRGLGDPELGLEMVGCEHTDGPTAAGQQGRGGPSEAGTPREDEATRGWASEGIYQNRQTQMTRRNVKFNAREEENEGNRGEDSESQNGT